MSSLLTSNADTDTCAVNAPSACASLSASWLAYNSLAKNLRKMVLMNCHFFAACDPTRTMTDVAASRTKALTGFNATPKLAPANVPTVYSHTSSSFK